MVGAEAIGRPCSDRRPDAARIGPRPCAGGRPGGAQCTRPLSERQVQALVETLRDDAAREELILALETLVEAERVRAGDAPTSEGTGFGLAVLSFLSQKVEAIGALATDVSRLVADLPELGRRLSAGAADPNVRERSFEFLLKLVLIV